MDLARRFLYLSREKWEYEPTVFLNWSPSFPSIPLPIRTMNLDRWIQGRNYVHLFAEASRKYDYGVVEGVMGLHDSGSQNNLSTHSLNVSFS